MSTIQRIFAIKGCTANFDLAKRWYVNIKIPNQKTGMLAWKKCYGDINKYSTVDERLKAITTLKAEIESVQGYIGSQGSRTVGYVNKTKSGKGIIFQFYRQLDDRMYRLRLSSKRRYIGLIKNLEAWLKENNRGGLTAALFTNFDAKEFLKWVIVNDKQSAESHNQHLRLFKSFFTELVHEGVIKQNPFAGIRGMARQSTPALFFGKDQVALLKTQFMAVDPQLWLFVNFVYYCFIRPGELRQLLLSDIDFVEARIKMRPEISKNKKLQYLSIPKQLLSTLNELQFEKYPSEYFVFGNKNLPGLIPLGVNSMKIRHQAILKSLKFSIAHKLYSWKHTGAIACARAGMPLKDLQMQLRHHSLDQVDQYLRGMLAYESEFIKNNFPTI